MARLTPFPAEQVFDGNGDPLSGGKVYTYEAGTTDPKETFVDSAETSSNANPVILDSAGRGVIWLGAGAYKIRVFDSADSLIDERDNIIADSSGAPVSYDVSSNTNITETYDNARIYATGTISLSLLPVSDADDGFEFWVYNTGTGIITVNPDGAEEINNAATYSINADGWAKITCDGDEWWALSGNNILNNLSATVAPTVNDDADDGYAVGSKWYDTTNDEAYTCLDATVGAAVWVQTTLESSDLGTIATQDADDYYSVANLLTQGTHIAGLKLSVNGTDSDHDIDISAGNCANYDGASDSLITLSAALTKQIDATFAEGDDAGGMFTGSVTTETVYYVVVISKDADGTIDAGFDTSSTGSNAPSGWTVERVIGSVITDTSSNIDYVAHYRDGIEYVETTAIGSISSGSQYAKLHGLRGQPRSKNAIFVCTAGDGGFSVGDEIDLATMSRDNSNRSGTVFTDSDEIGFSHESTLGWTTKSGGGFHNVDLADWEVKFYGERRF